MKNRTLFELQGEYLALYELLEETGGDITNEADETAFENFIAEIAFDRARKLEGYGWVIGNLSGETEAIETQIARLQEKAKRKRTAVERLKKRIHEYLIATATEKVETASWTFRRQKNGGKTPVVLDEYFQKNPVELPEKYRKVIFAPDLEKLREDLENADTDAVQYAELGERGEHLRIV